MSWTELEPIAKTVPRVKASISVLADGRVKLGMSFSDSFFRDLVGSGEMAGKVLLRKNAAGKFEVRPLEKGGARIMDVPAAAPLPQFDCETERCEVETCNEAQAIVVLPLETWGKAPASSDTAHKSATPSGNGVTRPASAAPSPPPSPISGGKKIDAVAYLTGKGLKVSRRGDAFVIAGQVESRASTLTIINRYRRAAELPLIGLAEFE
jgi:hypothetical protein